MKVVLVFPPFATPSYVPLGIAQLKSYIKQELPSTEVANLDLSIKFFNNLASGDFQEKLLKLCEICPKKCKRTKKEENNFFNHGRLFKLSIECLKDQRGGLFYNTPKYNYFITKMHSFWGNRMKCIKAIARDAIEKGHPVPLAFENLFDEDFRLISEAKPDLVGFSIFCLDQLPYSIILAKIIKEKLNLPIIFGGAFMSYIEARQLMDFFDFIDFVIPKEGEIALTELIRNFPKKKFDKVPGLYYRRKEQILFNQEKFIEKLDSLPFADFSDFNLDEYLFPSPVLPLIFSRGCFWAKCSFCVYHRHYPAAYKTKTIKRFISEVKHYQKLGVKHFFINDDVISAADLDSVSTALKKNRIKVFFGAITRPHKDFSDKVLRNIYSAGGRVLIWGVESSCDRILRLMRKGTCIKDIKMVLKNSSRRGIYNYLFMILGFPTQTIEEINQDIKFFKSNNKYIGAFFMHPFGLFKDSYIFQNPGRFEIKLKKENRLYRNKKNKTFLNSDCFNFECKETSNKNNLTARKRILKYKPKNSDNKFFDLEHSHMLLHASEK